MKNNVDLKTIDKNFYENLMKKKESYNKSVSELQLISPEAE